MQQFEKLLTPIKIKTMQLRNRMIMAAMGTRYAADGGLVTRQTKDYYEARAKGGVGLIIVECGCVYYPHGLISPFQFRLYDDKCVPGLKELVDIAHRNGAKICFQLHHAGMRTSRSVIGCQPVSASSIAKARGPTWAAGEPTRALTIPEIKEVIEAFAKAAGRVRVAGADAVEIHGAHGYLILNFLSPYSNKREDEYGGDTFRRTRFACEIVEAVRATVGSDYPILFRISADESVKGGLVLEETKIIARILEAAGVDVFDVSSGTYDSMYSVIPPAASSPGFRAHLAEGVKQVVGGPVITSGRINSPRIAEAILCQGKADMVSLGRALIADPDFPVKVAQGRVGEIRTCLACNQGCVGRLKAEGGQRGLMTCTLNPQVGREKEWELRPVQKTKKVFVIGGGPAGMEAALVSAQIGHVVTIFEKEKALGGQLRLASVLPHKEEFAQIVPYFEYLFDKLGVTVRLGTDVTSADVLAGTPDAVILATGAKPIAARIPRATDANTVTGWDVLRGKEVGETVVIVGGGSVGCEIAEFLAEQGKRVTIIEKLDQIARDQEQIRRSVLLERLSDLKVEVMVKTEIETLESGRVTIKGGVALQADTVVMAIGAQSNRDNLQDTLKNTSFPVHPIGDCAQPGDLLDAIHSAFHLARTI